MNNSALLDNTLAQLDALHAQDPRQTDAGGQPMPLELWHAGRMSAWLQQLVAAPDELLRIAVRAQHLQRWQISRKDYPAGRAGYLSWRRDQGRRAAETASRIMRECGYSPEDAERAAQMIRKQGLGRDSGAQTVEDCACLVFLENYFADFSRQVEHDHLIDIVRKTWRKMSPEAHALALQLPMAAETRALVEEALTVAD